MPGKINDFGPKKAFTAWGPTTIHPNTDMIHQHNLNHLESQLQAAANKAWKAFASEPKVTFATVTVGFPAVDKYCSAALSAVKAAERIAIAPSIILAPNNNHSDIARTYHYTHDFKPFQGLFHKSISQFDMVSDSDNKWEVFKIVDGEAIPIKTLDRDKKAAYPGESLVCKLNDFPIFQFDSINLGAKQKLYTTNINGIEVTTYGEPFKVETSYDTFHKPKAKNTDDYPNAKSPLGRTNKQHKLIMDMNKKGKKR